MSCEVRLIAHIKEIDEIRRCLFPTDDQRGTDSWLQLCKISLSPIGDVIAIANERKIVILTSKWDSESSLDYFHITYSGSIHEYDKVKALVCIPIIDHKDKTHDWTCILVGFDSGHVRCYTETCEILFEEQFHAEKIISIKCQSQHNSRSDISIFSGEKIYIQYQSIICFLRGADFFPMLKKIKSEFDKGVTLNHTPVILPKKWGFQDQSVINDSAVVGVGFPCTFDYLTSISTCGGFDTRRQLETPLITLVLAAGSKPFLGYHYAPEAGYQHELIDVAKAVASKLISALPEWLTGTKSQPPKQIPLAMQPAENMLYEFGLCDLERTSTEIIMSPDHKLVAVCDALGRVLVVDSLRGITLKIFKGYRDAQCSFTQVLEEKKGKNKSGDKVATFLNIYSPKKGTLEIFSLQLGNRIATFTASKHSILHYFNYGLMGFTTSRRSKYICPYTTILIDNDGQMKGISIPFHFALPEKNNKRIRDIHLYKKLRNLIKSGETEKEKLIREATNTCKELKTIEFQSQTIDMLLGTESVSATDNLNCIECIQHNLADDLTEEGEHLKSRCEKASTLLKLYLFATSLSDRDMESGGSTQQDKIFLIDEKEMETIKRLLDLRDVNSDVNLGEVHVSFTEDSSFSSAEFLSVFDLSKNDGIHLNETVSETSLYKTSEVLFKPYITGNHNLEVFQKEIMKTGLATKYLFHLFINFWVNRPMHIKDSLEKELGNLSKLIYTIAKTADEEVIKTEYSEISQFWSEVRSLLAKSIRPLSALTAATVCKQVTQVIETELHSDESSNLDDFNMEVLTQEILEWSMLIGKLEDVSFLSIILSTKPTVNDCPLPKLQIDNINVSLEYVLQQGRGSVTELVAKWFTSMGVNQDNINWNETLEDDKKESEPAYAHLDHDINHEKIFQQLNLLKTKFPYSLESSSLLANMAWEYAQAWQRNIQNLDNLEAAVQCLNSIKEVKIKQGIFQLIWNTNMKIVFENICQLINKVGKLSKERLCRQDTGLSDKQISSFTEISDAFLGNFLHTIYASHDAPEPELIFENIWEYEGQPLVELAVHQREVNVQLLQAHCQLSLVIELITMVPIKFKKPIDNLFPSSIVSVFFFDFQKKCQLIDTRTDEKLNEFREQFLLRLISTSMESITVDEHEEIHSADHSKCMFKCIDLAGIWYLDVEYFRRYQVAQLFMKGYDSLANWFAGQVTTRKELGKLLLIVTGKRLRLFLSTAPKKRDNFTALTPTVSMYLRSLDEEECSPVPLRKITQLANLTHHCLVQNYEETHKLASLLYDACKNLEAIHL
nr:rab3 GTPase-activating protein regulatory subunit [Leptinotarsa decemlineata]